MTPRRRLPAVLLAALVVALAAGPVTAHAAGPDVAIPTDAEAVAAERAQAARAPAHRQAGDDLTVAALAALVALLGARAGRSGFTPRRRSQPPSVTARRSAVRRRAPPSLQTASIP